MRKETMEMITVYYEEYVNDYNRRKKTRDFLTLGGFEDWFFGLCKGDYKRDISVPNPESKIFKPAELPYSLDVNAMRTDGCHYWIHMIRNKGIVFSDGKYTNRQKHWNDDTKDMCRRMLERRSNPKFDFV